MSSQQPINPQEGAQPVEVRLTEKTIRHLDERIAEAVRQGIQSAMTEEVARAFWSTGLGVLQEEATQRAGKFVIGGFVGLLRKLLGFALLGSMVYAVGGWAALAKFWNLVFASGSAP